MTAQIMFRTGVLALAWFFAVNAGTTLVAMLLTPVAARADRLRRASVALGLRLGPAFLSVLFVAAMFLPAHFALEPRDAKETLGVVWYGLAVAGGWLVVRGVVRAAGLAAASYRLRSAEKPVRMAGIEVYEVAGLGGVSLAGILRPRILVGRGVLEDLSPPELSVALAHETAHHRAHDNLVRWSFVCAPDLLAESAHARRLEQAWHVSAESLADARAVGGDRMRACHLASALVKVARHAAGFPLGHLPAWSALTEGTLLESRVHRLLDRVPPVVPPLPSLRRGLIGAAIALLVAVPLLAASIHGLTETLVLLLP